MFEVPSAAGGDEGLEGFAVEVAGERAGRVAALNRTPGGLVLLVDTKDAYRPLDAGHVARIELGGARILLTPEGERALAAAPAVDAHVGRRDGPGLVRHVPRELDALLVAGERVRARRSRLWYPGAGLALAGGIGLMAGPLVVVASSGSLRWLWLAVPFALLVAGSIVLWAAFGRDSAGELSARERAADAATAVLGVSPRTRRRG